MSHSKIHKVLRQQLQTHHHGDNTEIECRMGVSTMKGFISSVDRFTFKSILNVFKNHFQNDRGYYMTSTYDIVCNHHGSQIRISFNTHSGELIEVIEKRNKHRVDIETGTKYNVRLSRATEVDVSTSASEIIAECRKLFLPVHPWIYMQQRGPMKIKRGYGVSFHLCNLLWMYTGSRSDRPPSKVQLINLAGFDTNGVPVYHGEHCVSVPPQVCEPLKPFSRYPCMPFQIARLKDRVTFTLKPGVTMCFTVVHSSTRSLIDLHTPSKNTSYEIEYEVLPAEFIPHIYNLIDYDMHVIILKPPNGNRCVQTLVRNMYQARIHIFDVPNIDNALGSVRFWLAKYLRPDDVIVTHDFNYIFDTATANLLFETYDEQHINILGQFCFAQLASTVAFVPRKRRYLKGNFVNLSTMQPCKQRKKDPVLKPNKRSLKVVRYETMGMVTHWKMNVGVDNEEVVKEEIASLAATDIINIFNVKN